MRRARDRLTNDFFVVQVVANDGPGPRLGMAVSTRAAGHAVNRNRLRRLIRESFRMHREAMPAVDVLVTARTAAGRAANVDVFRKLADLWRMISSPS